MAIPAQTPEWKTPAASPAKEDIEEKFAEALQQAATRSGAASSVDTHDRAVKNLFNEEDPLAKKQPILLATSPEDVKAHAEAAVLAARQRRAETWSFPENGPFRVSMKAGTPAASPMKKKASPSPCAQTKTARMKDALEAWGQSSPGLSKGSR